MPESYKIQVKLGNFEFLAEGPEEAVKAAFEQFLGAAASAGPSQKTPPSDSAPLPAPPQLPKDAVNGSSIVDQSLMERVFLKDGDVVSLRMLPKKENPNWQADAVILLLYGFRRLGGMETVPVIKLNQGLRKSGIPLDRVDYIISVHGELYMKGGVKSGGRYTLNNQGVAVAERWLAEQFS
jgi:hypothetical protein